MKTIDGIYTSAKIYTTNNEQTNIDSYAIAQLQALCDNAVNEGCKMRIMPDVHPGKVGTIGLTQTVQKAILPNVVGIDIGCGMTLVSFKGNAKDFQKLDTAIRDNIPSGFRIREKTHRLADGFDFQSLNCYKYINESKAILSLGTLGGGNHFIEVDKSDDDNYLVIHSGSRHLGKEITEYYLKEGQKILKEQNIIVPYELTYLTGNLMKEYLEDLQTVQKYASLNRQIMVNEICKAMKWKIKDCYSCIHNYVEASTTSYCGLPIIRKGAISAKKGEPLIIPINMRDGIILATGLGNEDWNMSAPHGAGRIMKREDISSNYTVSDFKSSMKGIYSPSIGKDTLDEAPFAYRTLSEITDVIGETAVIDKIIKPVYNFKAGNN